jgi:Tfp pilus assembly protein PilF
MPRSRIIGWALALVTLLVYLPAMRYGFVNYDDQDYVTDNFMVQKGLTWAGIKWAFTTGHASNWHPITWLSHMTDCELFGLNPSGPHLINVLFHAANTILLFILLRRLTGALWPCAFIAALFAWHPLHVESVAWISERKDVLSTFFALLALLSYAKFVKEKCRRSFWFALTFFALGLMSKPMLVTLPFVMLLLDFWPLNRVAGCQLKVTGSQAPNLPPATFNRLALEKWPFFLLAAISCVITYLAQRNGEAVASLGLVPLHYRFLNTVISYGCYLLKMVWPVNLAVNYPLRDHLSWTYAATSAAALFLISWLVWRCRTNLYLPVGWLWFLGTLVPVIGLVQVGSAALADRYTYFPLVGIFIAATFGSCDLANRFHIPKKVLAAAGILILAACLILTENQLRYWRDSETLFTHALAVTENNHVAHIDLGVTLEEKGELNEALAHYRAAEQLSPELYQVHNNLGALLDKMGHPVQALAEFREAVRISPDLAFLHTSLGGELTTLGRFDEALKEFSKAGQIDPADSWPHIGIAKVFFLQRRDAEAVNELRAALRIQPENFQILFTVAHYLAANENVGARDGHAALVLATKANVLTGGSQPMVFDVLGMAFAETGDFTNAQVCAQKALDLATAAQMKDLEPLEMRLNLYKNRHPWRESFSKIDSSTKGRN